MKTKGIISVFQRICIWCVILVFLAGFFGFVMPSLIGFLIAWLIVIAINDFYKRRYRQAVRTFNSAVQAVAHQEGVIKKVVLGFAAGGALSRSCYQYALCLGAGEDAIKAAARCRIPLQLTTAVAMIQGRNEAALETKPASGRQTSPRDQVGRRQLESHWLDSAAVPAYGHVLYLIMTAIVTCVALMFMSIFVFPTMEKMFSEFGLKMPFEWLRKDHTPTQILLGIVSLALIIVTPILTTGTFFGIPVPRWMPVSPQVIEEKSNFLRGLADAIDGGMTIDQALQLATAISIKSNERRSLQQANELIRCGVAPGEALRRTGWLSLGESEWLGGATAQRGADLLQWIADQRVRDARVNVRFMLSFVFPLFVVILGLAVMAYCVGFFGALVSLISGLS